MKNISNNTTGVPSTKWTLFHQQTTMEEKKDGRRLKRPINQL